MPEGVCFSRGVPTGVWYLSQYSKMEKENLRNFRVDITQARDQNDRSTGKTVKSYKANGWEYMRTMDSGVVVLEIIDVMPAGEENPLAVFIYADGSTAII